MRPPHTVPPLADAVQEMTELFGRYGRVADVHLPRGKSFGFVQFENADAASRALELNGTILHGLRLGTPPRSALRLTR